MLAQVQQPFTITALGAQTSAVALPVPRASGECVLKAVARAATGPVHLNCQFREPLAPVQSRFER